MKKWIGICGRLFSWMAPGFASYLSLDHEARGYHFILVSNSR
jgi:hypothetical protein